MPTQMDFEKSSPKMRIVWLEQTNAFGKALLTLLLGQKLTQ